MWLLNKRKNESKDTEQAEGLFPGVDETALLGASCAALCEGDVRQGAPYGLLVELQLVPVLVELLFNQAGQQINRDVRDDAVQQAAVAFQMVVEVEELTSGRRDRWGGQGIGK